MPRTVDRLAPPTQMSPASSVLIRTRPSRPSAVLAHDVRRRQPAGAGQPHREAGVQAARDRVLVDAQAGAERAHLERPGDRLASIESGPMTPSVASSAANRGRSSSTDAAPPARVPATPARCRSSSRTRGAPAPGPQGAQDIVERLVGDGALAQEARSRKASRPSSARPRVRPRTPGPRLRTAGRAALLEPGVCAPQRRVPGKGKLLVGGEDAQPVVGRRLGGRQQERGLREVGPSCERRHLFVVETVGVVDHGNRVAQESARPKTSTCEKEYAAMRQPVTTADHRRVTTRTSPEPAVDDDGDVAVAVGAAHRAPRRAERERRGAGWP